MMCIRDSKKAEGVDLTGDKVAMQRLKEAAEKAKIELSGVTSTNINLPYILSLIHIFTPWAVPLLQKTDR